MSLCPVVYWSVNGLSFCVPTCAFESVSLFVSASFLCLLHPALGSVGDRVDQAVTGGRVLLGP